MKHNHILHIAFGAAVALAAVSTVLLVLRTKGRRVYSRHEDECDCPFPDCETAASDKYEADEPQPGDAPAT